MTLIDMIGESWEAQKKGDLTALEVAFYDTLIKKWNSVGRRQQFYITNDEIERYTGMAPRTVRKVRQSLADKKYIKYGMGKAGKPIMYEFENDNERVCKLS